MMIVMNVENTPHLDTDSSDVDRNPKPNTVEGLVGLTPRVEVGSPAGVALGSNSPDKLHLEGIQKSF